jgi:hypothetical protein
MASPKDKISKYFTYKEALWLPQENRMATEADGVDEAVLGNLKVLFGKMDLIREFLGKPIIAHICFRTMAYHLNLYKQINEKRKAQGLAELKVPMGSGHLYGQAFDFHVVGMTCDEVVKKLLDEKKLEEWGLRMEDNGAGANWVHIDTKPVGASGKRFFKP